MWEWHDWSRGWWLLMSTGMLAFWVAVAWFAVVAVRGGRDTAPDPESVLADRLARGEIDTDEYRQRLDALRDSHGRAA